MILSELRWNHRRDALPEATDGRRPRRPGQYGGRSDLRAGPRNQVWSVVAWVEDGATSQEHAAALLKNRLYRRWGIKTAREYARIKIDGLRLVGGNPDFTNAPGHGDDDARFYDRQQAYVHARGG